MGKNKRKLTLNIGVIIMSVIVALIFNIFLFSSLSNGFINQIDPVLYLLIIMINILYFVLVRVIFAKAVKRDEYNTNKISKIINNLVVAKPTFTENFNKTVIVDFDDEEEDEIIDESELDSVLILKPREVIKGNERFDLTISFDRYIDQMYKFFIESGLDVKKDELRIMLSSISASRLVEIKHESKKIAHRFVELFTTFIGANNSLVDFENNNYRTDTNNALDLALSSKDKINVITYSNITFREFEYYYTDFVDYSYHSYKFAAYNGLTTNLWFFIISDKDEITDAIADVIFSVNLTAKVVEPNETVYENENKLSFDRLMFVLRDIEETHYLEENHWKKIDNLEKFINNHLRYRIDNKIVRQLEKYSTIYILSGGEQLECLDSMLSSKLYNILNNLTITKRNNEDEGFIDLFDRLFGLENLIISKDLIKELDDKFILVEEVD